MLVVLSSRITFDFLSQKVIPSIFGILIFGFPDFFLLFIEIVRIVLLTVISDGKEMFPDFASNDYSSSSQKTYHHIVTHVWQIFFHYHFFQSRKNNFLAYRDVDKNFKFSFKKKLNSSVAYQQILSSSVLLLLTTNDCEFNSSWNNALMYSEGTFRYICTILVPKHARTKFWVYNLRDSKNYASVL